MPNPGSNIFMSYSRKDSDFALKLAKDLRSVGANIWIDQLDVKLGQNWDDVTEKALISCDIMLLVLSPKSVDSKNVRDEIAYALDEGKHIFPVLYEPCKVPLRVRRLQRSDFTDSYENGLNELYNNLNITNGTQTSAKLPIEILNQSKNFEKQISYAISIANSNQVEFNYSEFSIAEKHEFEELSKPNVNPKKLMNEMENFRNCLSDYHPHLLLITDVLLDRNVFGSSRGEKGVGVLTTNNVADIILPRDKIHAYIVYYLARYTLNYINFEHKNHTDTRNCVYDRKGYKKDILKSMRGDAFCQPCRNRLLSKTLTISQLNALNSLFSLSGQILNNK